MFSSLFGKTLDRLERRRRYVRLVEEIQGMSNRDLADIRGNRAEMLRHAYLEVYGGAGGR